MRRVFRILLVSGIAYWLVKRFWGGPKLAREDWSLYRDRQLGALEPGAINLDALVDKLRNWGYSPTLERPNETDDKSADYALLKHASARHGGVLIDLRHLVLDGHGIIEAYDTGDRLYSEMAKYALFELGKLIPGITYRDAYSVLTAESTDTLEPHLPEKPHYLPR